MNDREAMVIDSTVIGKTSNTDDTLDASSPKGVICSRSENFTVKDVRFFNFDFQDAAALGTCSQCATEASTSDSGARTVSVEGLYFDDDSVPRRISYGYPFRGIFWDLDGSLTDQGANSWAVAYWKHLEQPECIYNTATLNKYGGILCTPTVEVRRIVFYNPLPNEFYHQ